MEGQEGKKKESSLTEGVSKLAETSNFQKVEGMLYGFFDTERRLELLEKALAGANKELDDIQHMSQETYEIAASMGLTANLTRERIQGRKSVYCSPVEEAYLDICEHTEKLLARRIRLQTRVISLRQKTAGVRYALSQLSPFEAEIVECKYKYKMSTRQIGRIKGMHKNTIERQRQRIVEELGRMVEI
jgi:DNA-directed RNA polymerase specialized sigma subunit